MPSVFYEHLIKFITYECLINETHIKKDLRIFFFPRWLKVHY